MPAEIPLTVAFSTLDGNDGLFARILTFLQGFIVLLALIFIVIGGFLYITSAGDDNRMETAKKCILAALIGLALGIAAPAFLREIASILNWGGVNPPAGVGTSLTLIEIASRVLSFLLTIIGILAIIMLIIGGIMYLTAAGDEDQIDRGKKIVKYSPHWDYYCSGGTRIRETGGSFLFVTKPAAKNFRGQHRFEGC